MHQAMGKGYNVCSGPGSYARREDTMWIPGDPAGCPLTEKDRQSNL